MRNILDYSTTLKQYIDNNDVRVQNSSGVQLPHRYNLRFNSSQVVDDSANDAIIITPEIVDHYLDKNVTLSTSGSTTVTFTDSLITDDSSIDVLTDYGTLLYETMTITEGVCTVTFPQQASAISTTVRIIIQ